MSTCRRFSSALGCLGVTVSVLLGCGGDDDRPPSSADLGMDASASDAGADDLGSARDLGRHDLGPRGDAAVSAGCDPASGIECDGDWLGRCTPECAATECCSPQSGVFECVARVDGGCPAADLWIDATKIADNYAVEWQNFPPGDCAIVEGCVVASGWRRLLRFDTWTPNSGGADMYLGPPGDTIDYFEYSMCHDHYHFNTYAEYALRSGAGDVAATGHKQAFCLLDYYRYPGTDGRGAHYDCGNQGIQRGWQDVYGRELDCQWVDVTDVPAGDYSLRISVNTAHLLNEENYDNNVIDVPVTIPPDVDANPTAACPSAVEGLDRECGWSEGGDFTCTAGAEVRVGCSTRCGVGSCTGDSIMRVCEGTEPCGARGTIARNDDSGCGGASCRGGSGECCSQVMFTCPASGAYNVLWAPFRSAESATCAVAVAL